MHYELIYSSSSPSTSIRRMARGHKIPAHVIKNGCRTYYSFRASEVFAALKNDYGKEEITPEAELATPKKCRW